MLAVSNLKMSVRQDEIVALLGHNGAGKTTMLQILTGITEPTSGFVSIHGNSIADKMNEI